MTYIIAEIGGNHEGDQEIALQLIHDAKYAGADAVKFQIYLADKLVHPKAVALQQAKGYALQIDRFRDLEFNKKTWSLLITECKKLNIDFLATCFDNDTMTHYVPDMKYIKISSGDCSHIDLIQHAITFNKPILLSTGLSNINEVRNIVSLIPETIPVTVMHCVTSYPCKDEYANLSMIDYYRTHYNKVGYSDHTLGITACIVAAAMKVDVIEKHFTYNNKLDFGDHILSVTKLELAELVHQCKRIKKMQEKNSACLDQRQNALYFRRGVYSACDIRKGSIINQYNVTVLRPATQTKMNDIIGKIATQNYKKGDHFDDN